MAGPVLGRHIHRPPRQRAPLANLGAEEFVGGGAENFADGVEERLLHAGAEGVVPQQFARRTADDAVGDVVGNFGPGVVGDGFAPTDGAVGECDFAKLDNAPVRQPVFHMLVGMGGEGHVQVNKLDGFDLHWKVLSTEVGPDRYGAAGGVSSGVWGDLSIGLVYVGISDLFSPCR